jgi:hypothetical protein
MKLSISIGLTGSQLSAVVLSDDMTCQQILKTFNNKFNYRSAVDNMSQKFKEKEYGLYLVRKDKLNPLTSRRLNANEKIKKLVKRLIQFCGQEIESYYFVFMEVQT